MKTVSHQSAGRMSAIVAAVLALVSLASTGCQIDVAGQTLPSPYYLTDDVQYYAPGPEFKLANEAAALAEARAAEISEPQVGVVPPPPARPPGAVAPAEAIGLPAVPGVEGPAGPPPAP